MSCDFNILWIEDERDWYETQVRELDDYLKEHCLKLYTSWFPNGNLNENELSGNSYDLILIDYKLNGQIETGAKIIEKIRKNEILTDILFYSSDSYKMVEEIKNIDKTNESLPLDGIYYTNRKKEDFSFKLMKLIDKIIKRSEDVTNLRGIVLDNTCDFENRTIEFLINSLEYLNEKQKQDLNSFILVQAEKVKRQVEKRCDELKEANNIYDEMLKETFIYSHIHRLDILNKVIKHLSDNDEQGVFLKQEKFTKLHINYKDNINSYRNALGHKKENHAHIIIKINDTLETIQLDQRLHRQLRNTINDFDGRFKELEDYIKQLQQSKTELA